MEFQIEEPATYQENNQRSLVRSFLSCLARPDACQLCLFERISLLWKWVIVFFTIVLLFGSPIQILYTTKDADIVFDILYIMALVVFVLDIILNMLVDPAYFVFRPAKVVFLRRRVLQHVVRRGVSCYPTL